MKTPFQLRDGNLIEESLSKDLTEKTLCVSPNI